MPSNEVKINQATIWYVNDSMMGGLLEWLETNAERAE